MPSLAHAQWMSFVGDPDDLLQRFLAVAATDPDPHALSRAVIVGLSAAWEAYVEALCIEIASHRAAISSACAPGAVATLIERFHNPKVRPVRELVCRVLERDPWQGLTVGALSEPAVRRQVDSQQDARHQIAHGQRRPVYPEAFLRQRVGFMHDLVDAMDQHVGGLLSHELGVAPW
jgi:hypothetical protein